MACCRPRHAIAPLRPAALVRHGQAHDGAMGRMRPAPGVSRPLWPRPKRLTATGASGTSTTASASSGRRRRARKRPPPTSPSSPAIACGPTSGAAWSSSSPPAPSCVSTAPPSSTTCRRRPGDRVVLRLWSGALYLHRDRRDDPDSRSRRRAAWSSARGRGVVRIDAASRRDARLRLRGRGRPRGGRGARSAGERVYARDGEVAGPEPSTARKATTSRAGTRPAEQAYAQAASGRPLPEEVAPYADELVATAPGTTNRVGHVWRPYVGSGWQPYSTAAGPGPCTAGPGWRQSPGAGRVPLRPLGFRRARLVLDARATGGRPGCRGRRADDLRRLVPARLSRSARSSSTTVGAWHAATPSRGRDPAVGLRAARRRVRARSGPPAQCRWIHADMSQIQMLASRPRPVEQGPARGRGAARTGGAVRHRAVPRRRPSPGETAPELRTGNQATISLPRRRDGGGNSFGEAAGPATCRPRRRAADTGGNRRPPQSGNGRRDRSQFGGADRAARATVGPRRPRAGHRRRHRGRSRRTARARARRGCGDLPTAGAADAVAPRQLRAAPRERTPDDGGQRRAPPPSAATRAAAHARAPSAPLARSRPPAVRCRAGAPRRRARRPRQAPPGLRRRRSRGRPPPWAFGGVGRRSPSRGRSGAALRQEGRRAPSLPRSRRLGDAALRPRRRRRPPPRTIPPAAPDARRPSRARPSDASRRRSHGRRAPRLRGRGDRPAQR